MFISKISKKLQNSLPKSYQEKNEENLQFFNFCSHDHKIGHSWASASRLMPPASSSAFDISVWYRIIPLPDWVPLFQYRNGYNIVIFFIFIFSGWTY